MEVVGRELQSSCVITDREPGLAKQLHGARGNFTTTPSGGLVLNSEEETEAGWGGWGGGKIDELPLSYQLVSGGPGAASAVPGAALR